MQSQESYPQDTQMGAIEALPKRNGSATMGEAVVSQKDTEQKSTVVSVRHYTDVSF